MHFTARYRTEDLGICPQLFLHTGFGTSCSSRSGLVSKKHVFLIVEMHICGPVCSRLR